MIRTEEEIKKEIEGFINSKGGTYSKWYIGILKNPQNHLFYKHNLDENDDIWFLQTASSSEVAKRIKDYFINTIGVNGKLGGADKDCNIIYVYKNKH
ncbi:MAG: hypothetical protein ACFFG0_24505 [Candidatus Thorarchaeota archaeon]